MRHAGMAGLAVATCMVTAIWWNGTDHDAFTKVYRPGMEERSAIVKAETAANTPIGNPWKRDDSNDLAWPGMDLAKAERGHIPLKVEKLFPVTRKPIGGGTIDNSALDMDRIGASMIPRAPTGSVEVHEWALEAPSGWERAQLRISPVDTTYYLMRKVDPTIGPQTFQEMAKAMRRRFGLADSGYARNGVTYNRSSHTETMSIQFENRDIGRPSQTTFPVSSRLEMINMYGGLSGDGDYAISIFVNAYGLQTLSNAWPAPQKSATDLIGLTAAREEKEIAPSQALPSFNTKIAEAPRPGRTYRPLP